MEEKMLLIGDKFPKRFDELVQDEVIVPLPLNEKTEKEQKRNVRVLIGGSAPKKYRRCINDKEFRSV